MPTFRSYTSVVSRKSTVKLCSHTNSLGSKLDLAVKKVKVNSGSSFKKLGSTLHITFQGHRPYGFREEDFLKFVPYISTRAILVM